MPSSPPGNRYRFGSERDADADTRRERRERLRSEAWQRPVDLTGVWRWVLARSYRFCVAVIVLAAVLLVVARI
jgi:hypothetical protein